MAGFGWKWSANQDGVDVEGKLSTGITVSQEQQSYCSKIFVAEAAG